MTKVITLWSVIMDGSKISTFEIKSGSLVGKRSSSPPARGVGDVMSCERPFAVQHSKKRDSNDSEKSKTGHIQLSLGRLKSPITKTGESDEATLSIREHFCWIRSYLTALSPDGET